jgi:predicted dienelactone hydrolase
MNDRIHKLFICKLFRSLCVSCFVLAATLTRLAAGADYDPMNLSKVTPIETFDLKIEDKARARIIPIKVYLPKDSGIVSPVILFSHGLGGSKEGNGFMGDHWAKRGYVAVFLQHAGSDSSVWRETELRDRMAAMQKAASPQNLHLRCEDVKKTIHQLEDWNREEKHPLFKKLDLAHIGMSGHSFGAHTTQATTGQSFPLIGQKFTDNRIIAAIAFSPSSPPRGGSTAFASVKVPWMLMTGTKDTSPIGGQTVESRLEVYPNLPKTIDKYELVLDNAEHSSFSGRALPGDKQTRNPNHHKAILALSTAFWDAYLKDDQEAKNWLTSSKAKSVLEDKDRWQHQP